MKRKRLTLRIPEAVHESLALLAKDEERSINYIITRILQKSIIRLSERLLQIAERQKTED